MRRLLYYLLIVLLLSSFVLVPHSINAADNDTDTWKHLNKGERAWVSRVRGHIAQTRGAVSALTGLLVEPSLGGSLSCGLDGRTPSDSWSGKVWANASNISFGCLGLASDRDASPNTFKPIVGVFDGIQALGYDISTQAGGISKDSDKLITEAKLFYPVIYTACLIRITTLRPKLSNLSKQLNNIESAVETRITEIAEEREKAKQSSGSSGGWGCFIATAAYGTPNASEIDVLREFRDQFLMKHELGRQFVDLYYTVSPPIAEFIWQHKLARVVVREVVVGPVVRIMDCTGQWWHQH